MILNRGTSSSYLRRHLDGTGNGFDLDDLISGHTGDPLYDEAIEAVSSLMLVHQDQGLASAEARTELEALAVKLEQEGK